MAQLSSKTTWIELTTWIKHDKWKTKIVEEKNKIYTEKKETSKEKGDILGKKTSGYNNNKKQENMLSWKIWSVLKIEVKINTFFHETRD